MTHPDDRRLAASAAVALALHGAILALFGLSRLVSEVAAETGLVDVTLETVPAIVETPPPPAVAAPRSADRGGLSTPGGSGSRDWATPSAEQLRRALASLGTEKPQGGSVRAGEAPAAVAPAVPQEPQQPLQRPDFVPNADLQTGSERREQAPGAAGATSAPERPLLAGELGALDRALAAGAPGGGQAGASSPASGSASGPAQAGGGTQGTWERPLAGRRLVAGADPRIPEWVSKEGPGLRLQLLVGFEVEPSGLVRAVRIEESSGYPDVDAAVAEAVRRWRFEPIQAQFTVKGSVPYVIEPR